MTNGHLQVLRRLPFFSDLEDQELQGLVGVLKRHDVEQGHALYQEGGRRTGCYILVQGRLGLYKTLSQGKERRIGVAGPGRVLGAVSLLDGSPRSMTARAEGGRAMIVELPHIEFDMIMKAGSPLAFKFLSRLSEEVARELREVMKCVSLLEPEQVKEEDRA
jgi:CRP-like cAMP-binding protein